ncbi:MAG TPA: hypothetical protein PK020_02945 [Ilumatobacteraceae bacterium]|nr:hypothetical protein [Ilumatobacteraceae bacterium]
MQQQRWRCLNDNRFDLDDGCRNDNQFDDDGIADLDHFVVDHVAAIHSTADVDDRRSRSDS